MKTYSNIRQQQSGTALIVSLVILLVLTIMGVTSISSTNLEERMAQNFQITAINFQAAESAISTILNASDPGGAGADKNPFYDAANDPSITSLNAGIGDTSTVVNLDMDPNNHLQNATSAVSSTVVYGGAGACPGMSIGPIICHYFQLNANATIVEIGTDTTHVQGFYRPAPSPSS